jgi:hypothetical protein
MGVKKKGVGFYGKKHYQAVEKKRKYFNPNISCLGPGYKNGEKSARGTGR